VALLNERYKVGDELKRSIRDDILRLIEAKTYRCVCTAASVLTCVALAAALGQRIALDGGAARA
jgi:hypothetical protein